MRSQRFLGRLTALLALVTVVGLTGAPQAAAQPKGKVYAVIILDTDAGKAGQGDIREGAKKDGRNVEEFLNGGIGEGLLVMPDKPLQDEEATWGNLTKYLTSINPTPNDTLFCFITCHGGSSDQDPNKDAHILGLSGTRHTVRRNRSDVRSELVGKKAGLTILITDACSDDCPPLKKKDRGPVTFGHRKRFEVSPAFEPLFLEAKGIVDINASFAGQTAWSDEGEGGIFTRTLHQTFLDLHANEQTVTWPQFYNRLIEDTDDIYQPWRDEQIVKMEKEQKAGNLSKDQEDDLKALREQKTQMPEAYYLVNITLNFTVFGTDGEGMEVSNMPLDSPAAGKLKPKERIVKANGEAVPYTDDWKRVIQKALDDHQTRFTFEVIGTDGKKRTQEIVLTAP